ncbi:MAG: hypothetical protein M5U15_11965 [Kiritimatiellae bacterium]|nr:hypothetical protein [Kiritimatiellia bacterium]
MKKIVVCILAGLMLSLSVNTASAIDENRGGLMGFIAGCCFGIRAGAAYNDGKEIHWREWVRLVPVVSLVCAIWDGIDGANGMSTGNYAQKYGSAFY